MADIRGNELGIITDLIASVMKYALVYRGIVADIEDSEGRGRVRCIVPELGWIKDDESPWCEPEYVGAGCVVPAKNDIVTVWFINGEARSPYYGGKIGAVVGQRPDKYSTPRTRVLWESPNGGAVIWYDDDAKRITITSDGPVDIDGTAIHLNGDSKTFVTWEALNTAIGTFLISLNALFATKLDAGGAPGTLTLSIAAAQSTTLKTGG